MAFDGDQPVQVLLPDQLKGYLLTGEGDFPKITKREIKDKSKGNIVSRGLVVLQAGWFVLQCIARKAQGLPIAELELVTIAFAAISFAIFLLWRNKLIDVHRAVRVYKKRSTDEPSRDGRVAENENLNLEPTVSFWAKVPSLSQGLNHPTKQNCPAPRRLAPSGSQHALYVESAREVRVP
jgi:hypothetical protein